MVYSLQDSSNAAVTIAECAKEEAENVAFEDVGELLTLDLEETNTDDDFTQVATIQNTTTCRCAAHMINLTASNKYLSTSKSVYYNSFA